MAGVVSSIYSVKIRSNINGTPVDCSQYVTNIDITHAVQTLSPTFSIAFSKNVQITGGEVFDIEMGYGNMLVPILIGGTISTFSRTTSRSGVELVVNGRGPLAKIIDESPKLDRIYIPTWDKSYSKDGYWVNSACGAQRVEPVPPGVDPNQDPKEYEIFEGEWTVYRILKDIASKLGITMELYIPDAKYREPFRINSTQTWISAIQQLVAVWEPIMFMRDNVLYILDTDVSLPLSSNMQYGSDGCVIVNLNHNRNNIINRMWVKGGVDESVVPVSHNVWVPNIDTMQEFMGEDLSSLATESVISEHSVPSSAGAFTGSRIWRGYYKPLYGDPLHVYTRTIDYSRGYVLNVKLEVNYFKASGTFGPDQQVCTRVFKTRRQEFVSKGYWSEAEGVYRAIGDVYIEKGFCGTNASTDAADPQGQSILSVNFGGYDYFKVMDQEEMHDTDTGSTSSTSVSRTFGILPLGQATVPGGATAQPGRMYYLIGGVPVVSSQQLYNYQRINGYGLSYRIIQEKVSTTDSSSSMALKQTHNFDYTKMISDDSMPIINTDSEMVLKNQTSFLANVKRPAYQFVEYFEDLVSIGIYGYRPVVTYYDPSILDHTGALRLRNKVFMKSGRMEQEISIQPTAGNPLLSVGKSVILESATYKQVDFELYQTTGTQVYEDTTIDGGEYIINGVRHNFNKNSGFKTEISLRKLWKLTP